MSRLIVAFESEVTRQRVCELFAASSFPVRASCRTGAEVLRAVHFMGGGVVVCGVVVPVPPVVPGVYVPSVPYEPEPVLAWPDAYLP